MTRREDDLNRAAAHQKMGRIFTIQANQTEAAKQYRIARLLMGVTEMDQVYS